MEKAAYTPLFRNCPNADIFETRLEGDCRNCPNYERCIEKKAQRAKNRRKLIHRKNSKQSVRYTKVFFIITVIVGLIVLGIVTSQGNEDPQVTQTIEFKSSENLVLKSEPQPIYTVHNLVLKTDITEKEDFSQIKTEGMFEELSLSNLNAENNEEPEIDENQKEAPRISAYGPGDEYYYNITEEDKLILAKVAYKEARGEIFEGQVAVVAVVLNRHYSDDARFIRDSIYGTVTQRAAFASISNVTEEMVDSVPSLKEAVDQACRGWDPTRKLFENGALFFYAPGEVKGYEAQIREGIEVLEIGNHNFHIDLND